MPNGWKRKRDTIKHYDRTAKTYDVQYGEEQNAKIEVALKDLHLDHKAMILDEGCGTGRLFGHMTKSAKLIVGIDTSPNLLKQAKTKAKDYTNVAIIRADADRTPFIAETFNHAFAFTLLQNVPQPATTLEEMKRITRPKASLIITGLKKQFSLRDLTALLTNAQLDILCLRTDDQLKDHIAIGRKRL
ncbi:MAG TPA: class I SAM-dependent methyltransferase [Candidatus Bathyarchaeia archaeon]|nr:class I SAM-dependent methyltransferase [Candidatus Bathyarchaeia archaeon]